MGDRVRAKWTKNRGLLCKFPWGELGPHLTQCGLGRGLSPYQVASSSIQPFFPQYTNVTDRQIGQDRQDRQRCDNIRRTVLQTVAQKSPLNIPPHLKHVATLTCKACGTVLTRSGPTAPFSAPTYKQKYC